MVVVGNYSVCIVNAETKEPFKEHKGPDGKIYAEVEPDLEYYIEISVVGGGDKNKIHYFSFSVDGEKLKYNWPTAVAHGKRYAGSWSCVNGVDTMQAFALQRPRFTDSDGSTRSGALMGDITVDISEAIYGGTYTQEDYDSGSLKAATVSSGLTNTQTKKVLRSGAGSVAETKTRSKVSTRYYPGALLESITIHYCTALGLIHAGVFGKVEDIWAKARILNPWKPSSDKENDTAAPQPKRVKRGGKMEHGVKLEAPKEVDEFDFTADGDED